MGNQTVGNVAPNVGEIIGDRLTARLISKAGSLTNLAKMPACTVQILGAEKALFRAIKTKSATPKFGLLYNSKHISKANKPDKGRISRCLANKVSIASKIDCFSENLTNEFGKRLAKQVDDRLHFYETGQIPALNAEVMQEADLAHKEALTVLKKRKREQAKAEKGVSEPPKKKKKKDKQNGTEAATEEVVEKK